jgi:hypothetical protein
VGDRSALEAAPLHLQDDGEYGSLDEIQCRVAVAIRWASYSWPPPQLLRILPNEGTENLVSVSPLSTSFLAGPKGCIKYFFSEILAVVMISFASSFLVEVRRPHPRVAPSSSGRDPQPL